MKLDGRVLVVGDLALDEYWCGTSVRLAPEAPVPVVLMDSISQMPGRAGNVCRNILALGGEAILVSVVGVDDASMEVCDSLMGEGISTSYLHVDLHWRTSRKIRILSHGHMVTRVDNEVGWQEVGATTLIDMVGDAMVREAPDVLYFADYDGGVLNHEVVSTLSTICRERDILTVADPKVSNFQHYNNVDILKPNLMNGAAGVGMPMGNHIRVATSIVEEVGCRSVLLTLGERGMYYYDGVGHMIPPHYVDVSELSGAGDTAGAALSLGLSSGMSGYEASLLANAAASVVVQKVGTAVCTYNELVGVLDV